MAKRQINNKHKIGIIGVGFVGGALRRYLEARGVKLFLFDKYKKIGSPEEVNKAEIIFICVPTPYSLKIGFDLRAVESAVAILASPKVIVIKSSVIPGTTEYLQKKYPEHKFLFNPEFLRENFANYDMLHPDRQLVGFTGKSRKFAKIILGFLPKAKFAKSMPALEAEIVKYMANSFLAMRVVFANEFYDICKKMGADYNQVKQAVGFDPRIGHSHFDVTHDGYRGYGGSCFPKDVNAIIQLASSKKLKAELLTAMRGVNKKYLHQSGLNEEYFLTEQHKKKK